MGNAPGCGPGFEHIVNPRQIVGTRVWAASRDVTVPLGLASERTAEEKQQEKATKFNRKENQRK
jgi:hypothetical protein